VWLQTDGPLIEKWKNCPHTSVGASVGRAPPSRISFISRFNIGTGSTVGTGSVDLFFRQAGWTTVEHIKSTSQPFDGTWHHLAFVQQEDGSRTLYVDGVADELEIPAKPSGDWNVNDTTIGGILRTSASHWVTGLIDEVALWKRALSTAELEPNPFR
jgi:hypothetical protein